MGIFRGSEEEAVRGLLAKLEREVELVLVLDPEETPLPGARDIDFTGEARKLVEGLAELGDLVSARVTEVPELGVERFPALAVLADGGDAGIRYYGLPWGYEVSSLVGAVLEAGRPESSLHNSSLALLDRLERDIAIEVFVTPSCPHCPPAVLLAYRASIAYALNVYSVPAIVIDGVPRYDGAVPEGVFFQRLLEYA